jgi:hypothetical protein
MRIPVPLELNQMLALEEVIQIARGKMRRSSILCICAIVAVAWDSQGPTPYLRRGAHTKNLRDSRVIVGADRPDTQRLVEERTQWYASV